MDAQTSIRRMVGTLCGLALIGYGVISAIYGYINDSESIIFGNSALFLAILHLVLFGVAGLFFIAWLNPAIRPKSLLARDDESGKDDRL